MSKSAGVFRKADDAFNVNIASGSILKYLSFNPLNKSKTKMNAESIYRGKT